MTRRLLSVLCITLAANLSWGTAGSAANGVQADEETVYSGPQLGEKLPSFEVRGVLEPHAGKMLDFVTQADGSPLVLIFVHAVNRQSIALTRVLSQYTSGRADDGLITGIVWLHDDPAEAESTVKRVRHALAPKTPLGVSLAGREGPGSYGLNRNVMLTILVGNKGRVTANFALVQPSLQVDLPKILKSVVEVAGGEVPRLEDLEGVREMIRDRPADKAAPNLRPWLAPVIRREATPEEVDKAAAAVEERAADDAAVRKELGRIASTIVNAGKLKDYGTPRAQHHLGRWAEKYGPTKPAEPPAGEPPAPPKGKDSPPPEDQGP